MFVFETNRLDTVIATLISDLLLSTSSDNGVLSRLLEHLPAYEQKKILSGILRYAAETFFAPVTTDGALVDASTVSAVAGLVKRVTDDSPVLREQLAAWILKDLAVGLVGGIGVRRAAVAVLSEDPKSLSEILDKSLSEFGDQLFVKHAPIIQQEGMFAF